MKDSKLHYGHRDRMRERFITHGPDVFATYELLEMLLYSVISYKDTNDIAKLLMKKFGTLDALLTASDEEILEVRGVGKRVLELIRALSSLNIDTTHEGTEARSSVGKPTQSGEELSFCDYKSAGESVVRLLADYPSQYVTFVIVLDNSMNLIGAKKLFDHDLANGTVRSQVFINEIVRLSGSAAIIAHSHPFGPAFPTVGDMATSSMLAHDFERAGITLAENFIVCGKKFVGTLDIRSIEFSSELPIHKFLLSRESYYAENT